MVSVIYSDQFLEHSTGYGHPEKPGRLTAVKSALEQAPWHDQLSWHLPTPIEQRPHLLDLLQIVHTSTYIDHVQTVATQGGGYLDADTPVSPRSYDVALLAVSAWLDGVDAALTTCQPSFVLARPPGHHALSDRGMGFCLFSNAAVAAHYALTHAKLNRVVILDWDVHHGNGTQALVETHPQLAYCSLHQLPGYPGTGRATEQGCYKNVLNVPMRPERLSDRI
jgi:acetoin utilization deacetylase AcuC-like enzyme